MGQHRERARIAGLDADLARQAGHGFQVVGEHIRPGREHLIDRGQIAGEVAGQGLPAPDRDRPA